LAGRVAGRVVIVAAFGTALRVGSGPHAHVHGVYGCFASGEQMANEEVAQGFGVDPSSS
jgi:hypothetical protein